MPSLLWKIILGVAIGLVIIRGGGPALIRLALPVALVYFGYKALQRLAAAKLGDFAERMKKASRQAQNQRRGPNSRGPFSRGDYEAWPEYDEQQKTIEICPACGFQKSPKKLCTCA